MDLLTCVLVRSRNRMRTIVLAVLLLCSSAPGLAVAQQAAPVPDESTLARLVWTSMVAVDSANRTGNYSVLHALGSPDFQNSNTVADLAQLFRTLRENRVDVGRAILLEPEYHIAPAIDQDGVLRLRGGFEFRPQAIRFDILFQNIAGGWRIFAISVAEMQTSQR
ncbi:hypothetical protein [Pseudohongiella acticola]|jgi:hypothetical protein|nr:hypothetical protein [Pseudohongiella acticola]